MTGGGSRWWGQAVSALRTRAPTPPHRFRGAPRCLIPPVAHRTGGFDRLRRSPCGPSPWSRTPCSVPAPCSRRHSACTVDRVRVRWRPLCWSFRRRGACAMGPHPRVDGLPVRRLLCPIRRSPRASSVRETLPPHSFPTALDIQRGVSRVRHAGRSREGCGGMGLVTPSALCGSPVPAEGQQVHLCPLLQNRASVLQRSLRRQSGVERDGLACEGREARGRLARRARHASGDAPYHRSATRHLWETSLLLMASLRGMRLTLSSGRERFTPKTHRVPVSPMVVPHSFMPFSRRTERRL
jgi:hypothetical protein